MTNSSAHHRWRASSKGGHEMGVVNSDSNSLLQVLHNLNAALSDIERTRSSIQLKYRQLGSNWNDKKYKEYKKD